MAFVSEYLPIEQRALNALRDALPISTLRGVG